MKGDHLEVQMFTDLGTIRAMYKAADFALQKWPGGDPQEQANLLRMRGDLYAIMMSVLLENDLV